MVEVLGLVGEGRRGGEGRGSGDRPESKKV